MLRASALAIGIALAASGTAVAQSGWTQNQQQSAAPYQAQTNETSVYDLQQALSRAGYDPGPMDGALGPSTRRAIMNFQSDNGLTVTGSPNQALVRALEAQGVLTAQSQPSPLGSSGSSGMTAGTSAEDSPDPALVADVQAALQRQGYQVGQISGDLDADTRAAIRSFQRRQGLPASGQPSAELLALLETSGSSSQAQANEDLGTRDLLAAEHLLSQKGFPTGPVDGMIEPQTAQAIRQYQELRGFEVTGEMTPQLLADLEASNVTAQQAQTPLTPEQAVGEIFRSLGQRGSEQRQ